MEEEDYFVTVNFAPLRYSTLEVAYIYLGDGTASADILRRNATPFPLLRGTHYHAFVEWESRETFDSPKKAFWGLWNVSEIHIYTASGLLNPLELQRRTTYHIGSIYTYFPNPSPPSPENAGLASLRISWANRRVAPYTNVKKDHEDKTVVKGLSTVGGLVTIISGIFAFIFGGTLLYHLCGTCFSYASYLFLFFYFTIHRLIPILTLCFPETTY